jgi:hypothetical protein
MPNLKYLALGILCGYLGIYIYQLTNNTIQPRYFPQDEEEKDTFMKPIIIDEEELK